MTTNMDALERTSEVPQQDRLNRAVYSSSGVYRHYLSENLTPAEGLCLLKYQPHIAGCNVLDIGVGAGRTSRYLAPVAGHYEGIDYSPVMVAYMRKVMPELSVREADFRDLAPFGDNTFDFILATDNVIDSLSPNDRMRALREASRVLRPGQILAFSSHNIHYRHAFSGPRLEWRRNPVSLAANFVQYLGRWRNHLRVRPLRRVTSEYALLNDEGHDYACLHYYVARSSMKTQLESAGMHLIETFDVHGHSMSEIDDDSNSPNLLYVAARGK